MALFIFLTKLKKRKENIEFEKCMIIIVWVFLGPGLTLWSEFKTKVRKDEGTFDSVSVSITQQF